MTLSTFSLHKQYAPGQVGKLRRDKLVTHQSKIQIKVDVHTKSATPPADLIIRGCHLESRSTPRAQDITRKEIDVLHPITKKIMIDLHIYGANSSSRELNDGDQS